MAQRLLFDISTSMRWFGPPVGIVRVERELAKWAMKNDPTCLFVFFDADRQCYREVLPRYLRCLLEGHVTLDTTGMREPSQTRIRKTDRVPRILLMPFLWLTQFRRMARRALGGLSLRSRSSKMKRAITFFQNLVAGKGSRGTYASLNILVGPGIGFMPGDQLLFAGANWAHSNAAYIREQQRQVPFELVTLCYDIIPLLSPHFFKPHDVEIFRRHFDIAFAISALTLVTCDIIAKDVQGYCSDHHIPLGAVRKIPLGYDLPNDERSIVIPPQSRQYSRYIMLVSTIEPRKGHLLAQSVWSRLLREGLPQRLDAALFLVGRPGWLVDDLLLSLRTSERVVIFDSVDDRELAGLYSKAAFCIYPSQYEGYGLPLIEALGHGKAVLSSNVGVVPELDTHLLKRLPANDEEAWYQAIKEWLETPPALAFDFRHPTWQEAAAETFATIHAARPALKADQTSETARGG